MHSLNSRPPAAGLQQNLVPVWLVHAVYLVYFVPIIVLAVSLFVMAHTSILSSALSKPDRCLSVDIEAEPRSEPDHNSAAFFFDIDNRCGFSVHTIVVSYTLTQLACDQVGTGNLKGNSHIPDLAVVEHETTRLSFSSYCIACDHGQVSGFPPFAVVMDIKEVRGFHGAQVAAMKSVKSATIVLLNDQHHRGPLSCSGGMQPLARDEGCAGSLSLPSLVELDDEQTSTMPWEFMHISLTRRFLCPS